MTHETASSDTPALIDWTRPRWMVGELEIETARKLEREGKGRVYDDGDGGPVQWVPFGVRSVNAVSAYIDPPVEP